MRPGEPAGPDGWEGVADPADPLDSALLRDERDAELWRAVGTLKPSCQRLLRVMMADPPPSYAEVAAALDMRVGSVGPTRRRCLACLRERLVDQGAAETPADAVGGE
jgi:DNA-directed RNA polymerase specialized sigma24 family protein